MSIQEADSVFTDPVLLSNDLATINDFIKNNVFNSIKFLCDDSDLSLDGSIYQSVVRGCQNKVGGGRVSSGLMPDYMRVLWGHVVARKHKEGKKDKSKMPVSAILQAKRSSVYTVMRMRFRGK